MVETKASRNRYTSDINAGKLAFAEAYFTTVNTFLAATSTKTTSKSAFLLHGATVYYFCARLRDGSLSQFVSTLQAALST